MDGQDVATIDGSPSGQEIVVLPAPGDVWLRVTAGIALQLDRCSSRRDDGSSRVVGNDGRDVDSDFDVRRHPGTWSYDDLALVRARVDLLDLGQLQRVRGGCLIVSDGVAIVRNAQRGAA